VIHALDGEAPEIHPTAWIAPGAQVVGRVRIGPRASVWFNAVIRGDNEWIEIGEETNVQDGAVLHTDWGFPLSVGARCTIGHKAMLHGCTIGEGSLVGMSATVLNGSAIGAASLLGAGALVTERKLFDERQLLKGVPAKPVRRLEDDEVERLLASARHYTENAARFASGLTEITDRR
jgi:carbonic anhydrase/acetyltransferase-like protein (isoleucine patch superfamily)